MTNAKPALEGLKTSVTTVRDSDRELSRLRTLSRFLDSAVRVPGTDFRFGADSVIGLVPVVGDLITGIISLYILYRAYLLGIPKRTIVRMLGNILIDTVIGSVPVLGDLFDTAWKSNQRNVDLIERRLDAR